MDNNINSHNTDDNARNDFEGMPPPPPRKPSSEHVATSTEATHASTESPSEVAPPPKRVRFSFDSMESDKGNLEIVDADIGLRMTVAEHVQDLDVTDGTAQDEHNANASTINATNKRKFETALQSLIEMGVNAHSACERAMQENARLKHDKAIQTGELIRLRAALQQKQDIITNLYQAVETTKVDTRQASQSTVNEASLRAALAQATASKDEAEAAVVLQKQQLQRLQEQMSHCKAKLTRVTQEKLLLAREKCATLSVTRQVDQSASIDVGFYKGRITELNGKVRSLNSALLEKMRQNEDMQRQLELSMSRHAVAKLRDEKSGTNERRHPRSNVTTYCVHLDEGDSE